MKDQLKENKSPLTNLIKEAKEEMKAKFQPLETVCADCKHRIDWHYWTGIPSGEIVVDRCKFKGCECLNESDRKIDVPIKDGLKIELAFLEQQIRKTWKAARKDYLNLDFKKMEKVAKRINMTDEQAHSIIEKARREKK